ncbi:hypothetical protein [Phycicoccus sp. DTK01]|uniref:DUF6994 family protein n=1 Tax=Phycicoccus sp. DTK01 TaxID=2785745 RepID=UPI001A90550D|nr:hypothetical protein [Phycicoccus sp. DTK01]GIL33983.1 hypothetical protein PDTK01_00600 [Phycicoccus sp. DTK01]
MGESDRQEIDTSFDVRSDTPPGKDPDSHSATLRRYHRLLWSKPLPSGRPFELVETRRGAYLHHDSELGEFFLASDSVIPSYKGWALAASVLDRLDEGELEAFRDVGYTIGGCVVFPGIQIERKQTINGARGMHPRIADRMDLTLECVRRFYAGDLDTPLGSTLQRYADFFALFGTFEGYVDFFLLQDLVDEQTGDVRFFLPFGGFGAPAVPQDVDAYRSYRDYSVAFVEARNARIDAWARQALDQGGPGALPF